MTIEEAARRGAQAIEVDVWLSKDGVAVVHHDATLDRTTNGHGPLSQSTLQDLRALDADPHPTRVARIPTLDEVLRAARRLDLKVELELKTELDRPDETLAAIVERVRALEVWDRVWVSSFDPTLLYAARTLEPRLITALCIREDATGNVLIDRALTSRWLPWALGVSLIEPHLDMVDAASIAAWHHRGYALNIWTVNSAADQERLADLGAGYTSNCPGYDCADHASD